MRKIIALVSGLLVISCAQADRVPVERLLVRSAQVVAEVERLDGVEAALRARVEALGGFMTNSEHSRSLTLSFRVPSARLDAALADVEAIAKRVDSRQVKGEDFTEEFVDLHSQIANLEATRTRLRGLLEKSSNVDEALHVNKALSEVQGELEKLTGRAEFLRRSGELATVTVSFIPDDVAASEWRPLEVARVSAHGLLLFVQAIASLLIALAVFSPVWGPIAFLLRKKFTAPSR